MVKKMFFFHLIYNLDCDVLTKSSVYFSTKPSFAESNKFAANSISYNIVQYPLRFLLYQIMTVSQNYGILGVFFWSKYQPRSHFLSKGTHVSLFICIFYFLNSRDSDIPLECSEPRDKRRLGDPSNYDNISTINISGERREAMEWVTSHQWSR